MVDIAVAAINLIVEAVNAIPMVDIKFRATAPDLAGLVGLEEGGIVTGPTAALIGEGSESEAVLPLSKLNGMLDSEGSNKEGNNLLRQLNANVSRLISAVEKGGDVYMDSNKVGKSLALAASNMG